MIYVVNSISIMCGVKVIIFKSCTHREEVAIPCDQLCRVSEPCTPWSFDRDISYSHEDGQCESCSRDQASRQNSAAKEDGKYRNQNQALQDKEQIQAVATNGGQQELEMQGSRRVDGSHKG